jgi:hypothetical protein
MTNPPSSRPRSSRRRRRALVLPPDAVPRITTTNGPDLTAPLAPVLTRSAHFFVLIVDPVGAMLTSGLWISSFLVALTFATIMHFLDYGRSHRATEFSGAIALPYEAAKWCLNLAIRLVPNVSALSIFFASIGALYSEETEHAQSSSFPDGRVGRDSRAPSLSLSLSLARVDGRWNVY